jgi:hypothetical protein
MPQLVIPLPKFSLSGAKTYIIAAATVLFAGLSYWQGTIDMNTAITLAFGASGLGALRHGISTTGSALGEKFTTLVLRKLVLTQAQAAQDGVNLQMRAAAGAGPALPQNREQPGGVNA